MAERVRALDGRIERLGSDRQLVWFYREWMDLEEYWLHAPHNDEALAVLRTCLENAAWTRAQRLFRRAREAKRKGRIDEALELWRQGRERLAADWEVFYRREDPPDPGELYVDRIRGP